MYKQIKKDKKCSLSAKYVRSKKMQLNMFYNANQKVKGTNSTYRIEGIKTGKR